MNVLALCLSLALAPTGGTQPADDPARLIVQQTIGYANRFSRIVKGPLLVDIESFQSGFQSIGVTGFDEADYLRLATPTGSRKATKVQAVVFNAVKRPTKIVDDGVFVRMESIKSDNDVITARVLVAWSAPRPTGYKDWPEVVDYELVEISIGKSDNEWKLLKRSVVKES